MFGILDTIYQKNLSSQIPPAHINTLARSYGVPALGNGRTKVIVLLACLRAHVPDYGSCLSPLYAFVSLPSPKDKPKAKKKKTASKPKKIAKPDTDCLSVVSFNDDHSNRLQHESTTKCGLKYVAKTADVITITEYAPTTTDRVTVLLGDQFLYYVSTNHYCIAIRKKTVKLQRILFKDSKFLFGLCLLHRPTRTTFVVLAGHFDNLSGSALPATVIPTLLKLEQTWKLGSLMTILIGDFNRTVELLRPLEHPPLSFKILREHPTDVRCSYIGAISCTDKLIDNILIKNPPSSTSIPQVTVEVSVLFTHPVVRLTIPLLVKSAAAPTTKILNWRFLDKIKNKALAKKTLDEYPFLDSRTFFIKAVDAVFSILRKCTPKLKECTGVENRRKAIAKYIKHHPTALNSDTIANLWCIRYY